MQHGLGMCHKPGDGHRADANPVCSPWLWVFGSGPPRLSQSGVVAVLTEAMNLHAAHGREYDIDFLRDSVGVAAIFTLDNTVIAFDTAAEEQLDATVSSCPGAEQPDAGSQ